MCSRLLSWLFFAIFQQDIYIFNQSEFFEILNTAGWPQFHWKHVHNEEILYKYFPISKNSIKESFWIIVIIPFSISDIFDKH